MGSNSIFIKKVSHSHQELIKFMIGSADTEEVLIRKSLPKRHRKERSMKICQTIMMMMSFLLLFPIVGFAEDDYQHNQQNSNSGVYQQQNMPPSYDYRRHSYDAYQRSQQTYQNNPTTQNYQIMQQRKQIWQIRERQYKQQNWK